MTRNLKRASAALLVPFVLLVASCSDKDREQYNDAPRGSEVNRSAADTIAFPDGYSNVSHKCDGPNMVYVVFHNDSAYGSVSVVKDDPRCTSGE